MPRPELTPKEIKLRLIRLNNLERLYKKQVEINDLIKEQNRMLRHKDMILEGIVQAQQLRIEELEKMVFGKAKKKPGKGRDGGSSTPSSGASISEPKPPRSANSYRRPTPPDEAVTAHETKPIEACNHCGGALTDRQLHERFVEDIVLAALSALATKTVTKVEVESGYCKACDKRSSAMDLRGQTTVLGPNVRLLVAYLTTILDLTYNQIGTIIFDLYGLKVTDGEIASILSERALTYLPQYEDLKVRLRAGPGVHLDETGYQIQAEGGRNYAWAMVSSTNDDVVFHLSDSRGKGNAVDLLGSFDGVRITDCYGGYKNLTGAHQICWAHLYRNARDLADMECLDQITRNHCIQFWDEVKVLYAELRTAHEAPFNLDQRTEVAGELLTRVHALCQPHKLDPKKLADLKSRMLDYDQALFTCLLVEGIPPDNNKAERHLRKLVIKRKKSFGCKTKDGAKALSVLLSVCWSTWYRDRGNFFPTLQAMG